MKLTFGKAAWGFLFVVTLVFLYFFSQNSHSAEVKRSNKARMDFVKKNACPATGKNRLPCKGYVIDHVVPLCAGGADAPTNMQWQTIAEAKKKDVGEKQQCALKRKLDAQAKK